MAADPSQHWKSPFQFPADCPSSTPDRLAIPRASDVDPEGPSMRRGSLQSLRQAGGLNSFDGFARSWQRAAGFWEVTPRRPSFVYSTDDAGDETDDDHFRFDEERPLQRKSILRQALEAQQALEDEAVDEEEAEVDVGVDIYGGPAAGGHHRAKRRLFPRREDNILSIEPLLASPFAGSYASSYGSLGSRLGEASMKHAGRLWEEQQITGVQKPDKEREPLLVKRVEREDGTIVNVVLGQSTVPQTIFNSMNVLIGVGLLSLPLGIKYAGWLIGMAFLLFSTIITNYTAKVLAKCLDVDGTLITFADLAYISFGYKARIATSVLFTLELVAANVALVVLFADSWDALLPGVGLVEWKIVCGVILTPLSLAPLRVLSFTSVLGIVCCFGIVSITFIDGLMKPHAPGSLREPMPTYLFPERWSTLPLSLGLLMSPWGGHSVFPNIYRDMRHPKKYNNSLKITYMSTYLLDMSMAIAGLLMFGEGVRDEITSNIITTSAYPEALSILVVAFTAIIPLTKIPLNARPILSTTEILLGLDPRAISDSQAPVGMPSLTRGILKFSLRIFLNAIFIVIAIVFPSFDRIMALMGSALCFTICIILPLCFYLKIFGDDVPLKERILDYTLIAICSVMSLVGTVWAFLPKESIGAT